MFIRKILPVLLFSVSLSLFPFASESFEGQLSKHVLDNGLTVLVTEMPSSPVVSVYGLVKTGSSTEGKYLGSGISHFLEHMVFKGTHHRGVGELASRIHAVGGQINAQTSRDYTIYTITVPHESFKVALDILSDMLTNATMDPQEVERERNVILGEMRMRDDYPDSKISELTFQNVYLQHPYRHPIIGYRELFAGITRDDLLDYYKQRYVPNNTILSIAGNIDGQKALASVEETFKDVKRRFPVVRNLPREPGQISPLRYEEKYPTDLARLSMAFRSVELLHPDLYALDVLAKILGQGKSSRLYLDVYKKQALVHSISASNYTPMDKGLFWISALLESEKVDETVQAVLNLVDDIKQNGVKAEELEKAKQQARSEHIFDQETSSGIAYSQAVDEAFTGDPQFSKKYVEGIGDVTLDDIKRVANTYLIRSRLTTVILDPKEKQSQITENRKPAEAGKIQKHVLDNGLTVLLKEDPSLPVVAIQLAANGGVRQEGIENNGLFSMMASMWTKGTKNKSADQIAGETEGLGMHLSGFSGRNSFGLSMEFLTEQLPTAMDLLEELVLHPTFPKDEMTKVKEQMKTAILQRKDNIFDSTAHLLKETLFLTHPFRLEKEGSVESIDGISQDDLKNFYERFAVPGNMVLSIFGDIDSEKTLKEVKDMFGSLKNKKVSLKVHKEEPPDHTREQVLRMEKEQAMVMFGFQGLPFYDQDSYGLEVLAEILGSSFSGRLFTNIREQLGQAYTLGGGFIPGPDMGFVYLYVLTSEEQVEQVKGLVKSEIKKLQSEPVSDEELINTKTYLKGMFEASQETSASLAFTASLDELYGLGFDHYRDYNQNIDGVTREDIQRLAQKFLDSNKAAVVVTLPEHGSWPGQQ